MPTGAAATILIMSVACARFGIGWIDTSMVNPDQYFTILRFRDRHVPQAHDSWFTVAVENRP
jgi:hypothetical protein